jgi:hypothetical protein
MALDLASLLTSFDSIFFWLDKFAALLAIWWIGGKLVSRFETKITGFTAMFLRIVSGVVMYYLGIIVGTNFLSFLPGSVADVTGALVVLFFFYVFTVLLTKGMAFKMVTRDEFTELLERFDKLEAIVSRLVEATTSKKIMPEKLTAKNAENSLKRVMAENKKITDYVVLDSKTEKAIITFHIKSKVRSFEVKLDAHTGKLVSINHMTDTPKNVALAVANYVYEHKAATLGAILIILFVNALLLQSTSAVEERIANLLSFEPPQTNETSSFQDILGNLGFIPQGSEYTEEELQEVLGRLGVG